MLIYKEESPRKIKATLTSGEAKSIYYHDIFDYPLTYSELIKWEASDLTDKPLKEYVVEAKNGFFFKKGRSQIIYKRLIRTRISKRKLYLARRAAKVLALIKSVRMVGLTGSLAMQNAGDDSDIDLMIITSKNNLWITRPISYALLKIFGFAIRKPNSKDEKDKLCLNIWLDEKNLVWDKKNRYTAHEIAQVVPLYEIHNTYAKFINANKWVKNYWPNSIKVSKQKMFLQASKNTLADRLLARLNEVFFKIQLKYMGNKISNETVAIDKALFHPVDWSKVVLKI